MTFRGWLSKELWKATDEMIAAWEEAAKNPVTAAEAALHAAIRRDVFLEVTQKYIQLHAANPPSAGGEE